MKAYDILLVGSIAGLDSEKEVFETVSKVLGPLVKRIPDGETGARALWVGWQGVTIARNSAVRKVPSSRVTHPSGRPANYNERPYYEVIADGTVSGLTFADLKYAASAIHSFKSFAELKRSGVIGHDVRFQVSLPTPLAIAVAYFERESQPKAEAALEARLFAEVDQIARAIPHDQLAIQWDVAAEIQLLEGVAFAAFDDLEHGIVQRLVRLADLVPRQAELGYHLCYGDLGHRHFKEPKDTALLVGLANRVINEIRRPITWLHLPVPRLRNDDDYFAPLRGLRRPPDTELYLGLIHFTDGVPGSRRRMATAARYCTAFGISTECGMGRRPPETIRALLDIHRQLALGE